MNNSSVENNTGDQQSIEDQTLTNVTVPTKSAITTLTLNQEMHTIKEINNYKLIESQLKQAMYLASTRSALLIETENRLAIAQGRIKSLERNIEETEKTFHKECEKIADIESSTDGNIQSLTITSLQNLLLEKDTTMLRYQDLLRDERQTRTKVFEDYRNELKSLQQLINNLEVTNKLKDYDIDALRIKIKEYEQFSDIGHLLPINHCSTKSTTYDNDEYAVPHTLPDKYIEDMFLDEHNAIDLAEVDLNDLREKLYNSEEENKKLQTKLRDVSNRELVWEKNLTEKTSEIAELNERYPFCF